MLFNQLLLYPRIPGNTVMHYGIFQIALYMYTMSGNKIMKLDSCILYEAFPNNSNHYLTSRIRLQ